MTIYNKKRRLGGNNAGRLNQSLSSSLASELEGVTQVGGGAGLDGLVTGVGNLSLSVITNAGATQLASGASVGELWYTLSHATLPDGVVMRAI